MADTAAAPDAAADAPASKKRQREPDTAPLPDELSLPSAAVMRIVKSKLPEGMYVGAETKKAFGKACSLFILYLSTMCARRPPQQHHTAPSCPCLLSPHAGTGINTMCFWATRLPPLWALALQRTHACARSRKASCASL